MTKFLRRAVIALLIIGFLTAGTVFTTTVTASAGATGPVNEDSGSISVDETKTVCNEYSNGPQKSTGIVLLGHKNPITTECQAPRPPISTIAVICRAGLSSLDGQTGTKFESVEPNSPGAQNDFYSNDKIAAITVLLSPAGLRACAADNFCYDWGIFSRDTNNSVGPQLADWTNGSAICNGRVGTPRPTVPPPPRELNVFHIKKFSDGVAFYALLACIVGVCVSASLWAMGSKGQNPGTELAGKKGLILCCTAAFAVGAVPYWLHWLDDRSKDANLDTAGIGARTIPTVSKESSAVPTIPPAEERNITLKQLKEEYDTIAAEQPFLKETSDTWDRGQVRIGEIVAEQRRQAAAIGPTDKPARIRYVQETYNAGACGAGLGQSLPYLVKLRQENFDLTGNANADPSGAGGNLCTLFAHGAPVQQFPSNYQQGTAYDNPGNCTEKRRTDPRVCITDWAPGKLGFMVYADTRAQCEQAAADGLVLPKDDYCQVAIPETTGAADLPPWAYNAPDRATCEADIRSGKLADDKVCLIGYQPGQRAPSAVVINRLNCFGARDNELLIIPAEGQPDNCTVLPPP